MSILTIAALLALVLIGAGVGLLLGWHLAHLDEASR